MKKILYLVLSCFVLLIAVMLIKTAMFSSKQMDVKQVAGIKVDMDRAVQHLSKAITLKTVSYQDPSMFQKEEFLRLHNLLEASFPLVHRQLKREVVAGMSLLYTWEGSDKGLKPVIMLAHQDVVPIAEGTAGDRFYAQLIRNAN